MSDIGSHASVRREAGLSRELLARHQAMVAIGGAIGTGLFLGSGLAIRTAGPGVILSYVILAIIAWLLGAALIEMAVVHPTAGSFGIYAEIYVSRFAGYAVRLSYWIMQLIATGGHMVAISIYMHYWFPDVPGGIWIVGYSIALVYINARAVGTFGEFEYWFVMIKVIAIAIFAMVGVGLIFGLIGGTPIGTSNYVSHGGFLPHGLTGVWLATCFVLYAWIAVEVVAVTSGEAVDPARTIPRAMRYTVVGLGLMYLTTITVLVGLMPWTEAGIGESPFVTVLRATGIPYAAGVMNFVILTAALSAANANLYLVARTLFSLARAGYVPEAVGSVNQRGTPVNALLTSCVGLAVAVVVRTMWPESAYVWFLGVALFGAFFLWGMIFLMHIGFRRAWAASGRPLPLRVPYAYAGSVIGAIVLGVMLVTTWWVPGLRVTLPTGVMWMLLLVIGYRLTGRRFEAGRPLPRSAEDIAAP
jgi:AAT family amino acid transporter